MSALGSGCGNDQHIGVDGKEEDGVRALVAALSQAALGSGEVASVAHFVPTWEEEVSSRSNAISSHYACALCAPCPLFIPAPGRDNTYRIELYTPARDNTFSIRWYADDPPQGACNTNDIVVTGDVSCGQSLSSSESGGTVVFLLSFMLCVDSVCVVHAPGFRPSSVRRSDSVSAYPPSGCHSPLGVSASSGTDSDLSYYDEDLVPCYDPHWPQRVPLPDDNPMFNMFVGTTPRKTWWDREHRPRNIRIGRPAVGDYLEVGEVVRWRSGTFVHNLEGRCSNAVRSSMQIKDGHHYGMNCHIPHSGESPLLPSTVHAAYLYVRKIRWCSAHSVAFHSFAWPRKAKEAKPIARTLFTNHCSWAGVLVVRGRCFCSHGSCLAASRALENLLWNWSKTRRPFLVYKEGSADTGGVDLVPARLTSPRKVL